MKKVKKIVSVMLAAVMALAMSITAFAGEIDENAPAEETLKVTGQSYDIYQIFTGKFDEGKLVSDIKWGQNGTKPAGTLVSQNILDDIANTYKEDDNENENYGVNDSAQLAVITKYVDLGSKPIATGTETKYTGLASGYYLVKGTVTYAGGTEDENAVETLYVVRVVDDTLEFEPKVDVPKVSKKIVEGNDKVDTNEAAIGDVVNYEITGTLPSNLDAYEIYYFKFNDTLSEGLTLDESSIKVTTNGADVDSTLYTVETKDDNGNTIIGIVISDAKKVAGAGAEIVVTYSATLNDKAIIAGVGNDNSVYLDYSNDPNHSGNGTPGSDDHPTGKTPEEEVKTYTTELAVLKTDESGAILEGAEFTLTGQGVKVSLVTKEEFVPDEKGAYWKLKNGSYTTMDPVNFDEEDYDLEAGKFDLVRTITPSETANKDVVSATIDEDGRITFTGLGAGSYTLTESKVPDGYNAVDPIEFTISFDPVKKVFSADGISLGINNTLETTVINKKGSLLPSTGGIGTTIFYIIGGILVIGAGIILVVKKRMSHE